MKRLFIPMLLVLSLAHCPLQGQEEPPLPTDINPNPSLQGTALTRTQTTASGLPELRSDQGYYVENAPINEVFQYLTRLLNKQYFYNNELSDPKYNVSGHLLTDSPQEQMDELALAFGLSVYSQGSTVYLMNDQQLAKLPLEVMLYQLRYLRGAGSVGSASLSRAVGENVGAADVPADFEKLKSIIRPMLTKEVGLIEFEEKTNTLLITDNAVKLQKVRRLLEDIDRPKRQIAINVRILRVKKNTGRQVGVDWSSVLGDDGLPISITQSLNAAFNLPDASTLVKTSEGLLRSSSIFSRAVDTVNGVRTTTDRTLDSGENTRTDRSTRTRSYTDGTGLTFDPVEVTAIIRALEQRGLITQEACPTVITEDNEQGLITIVDRFPIILSQITNTTSGTNVTDQVRYKVDEQDPDPMREPQLSREIGVTLSVTPTLLPDGTVRMRLRPRVANVVEFITGESGNIFPRVSESTVEGISRVPAGQSLFLGGFYDSTDARDQNKVPVLGSIPVIKHLFRSNLTSTEQVSLVFIITPTVYDAGDAHDLPPVNDTVMWNSGFNRTNPHGPVTPLLPDIDPHTPGYLPVPMDRPSQGPAGASQTGPARSRGWFGRLFTRPSGADAKSPSPKRNPLIR